MVTFLPERLILASTYPFHSFSHPSLTFLSLRSKPSPNDPPQSTRSPITTLLLPLQIQPNTRQTSLPTRSKLQPHVPPSNPVGARKKARLARAAIPPLESRSLRRGDRSARPLPAAREEPGGFPRRRIVSGESGPVWAGFARRKRVTAAGRAAPQRRRGHCSNPAFPHL